MQYSILMNLKNQNHPQYQLFKRSPQTFLEVKGEWSLGKVSESIHIFGLHKDIDRSTDLYRLSKTNDMIFGNHEFNTSINKYKITEEKENDDFYLISKYFSELLSDITKNQKFIYPEIRAYSYPKRKTVKLLTLRKGDKYISRFRLSIDRVMDELEKTDILLRDSRSGEEYFGVEMNYDEEEHYPIDKDTWEKDIGKVLKHKYDGNDLLLLIKWKYLSLESSTWVYAQNYKENHIIVMYLHKNDLME